MLSSAPARLPAPARPTAGTLMAPTLNTLSRSSRVSPVTLPGLTARSPSSALPAATVRMTRFATRPVRSPLTSKWITLKVSMGACT
ncbi:hypothetical protein MPH_01838 [Macrophomina phaseolina MS6]|uniref:Uncharacterized protein n=1 Tax=Macrophomina phaseolina (strain MS6) TaxID=1126212 RepID=K2SWA3_MACPH|nr:hypothetical protein MPH_01838 [Macrophomina phaseolina MS6]